MGKKALTWNKYNTAMKQDMEQWEEHAWKRKWAVALQ